MNNILIFDSPPLLSILITFRHVFGHGQSEAVLHHCIEKTPYGQLIKQMQELDRTPGTYYHYHLDVANTKHNPDRNSDNESPQSLSWHLDGNDELEYADNPAGAPGPAAYDMNNVCKRKHDEDEEEEEAEGEDCGHEGEHGGNGLDNDGEGMGDGE